MATYNHTKPTNSVAFLLFCLFVFLITFSAFGQNATRSSKLYFRRGSTSIQRGFRRNDATLKELNQFFSNNKVNKNEKLHIKIYASVSLDGTYARNSYVSSERALALKNYIADNYAISQSDFEISYEFFDIEEMIKGVKASKQINQHSKSQIIAILSTIPSEIKTSNKVAFEKKVAQLKALDKERAWLCMYNTVFDEMCYGYTEFTIKNDTLSTSATVALLSKSDSTATQGKTAATTAADSTQLESKTTSYQYTTSDSSLLNNDQYVSYTRPLFAVKTNLLFDALTATNVEIEVPLGKRWSIAGEYIFPWWTNDNGTANSQRNRLQLLNGTLMGKYWLGNREERPVMTGWYAGAYLSGGVYDIEKNGKGYQSDYCYSGGLSFGYAHTINKKGNLRLEYSLNVGYMESQYQKYVAQYSTSANEWRAVRQERAINKWIGPTNAKISLVWVINSTKKVRVHKDNLSRHTVESNYHSSAKGGAR